MSYRRPKHLPVRLGLGIGVSALALGMGSASAQVLTTCPDGSEGPVCIIENEGESEQIVGTIGTALRIINAGEIAGGPAINAGGAIMLSIENQSSGLIFGGLIDDAVAIAVPPRTGIPLLGFNVTNAGTIQGNVTLTEPLPAGPQMPLAVGPYFYISDGGTLIGDLTLGSSFSSANFIQRGEDTGVTGTITAGQGLDIHTRSYSTSQSLTLGARPLINSFEIEGFEVRGSETTVTLTGAGTTISLMGDGNVINNGTINPIDTAPYYPQGANVVSGAINYYQRQTGVYQRAATPPGQVGLYLHGFGDALNSFVNNGTVNGDIRIATASFDNTGDINLQTGGIGSIVTTAAGKDFVFRNSGNIEMSVNGLRPAQTNIETEFDRDIYVGMRIRQAIETTTLANAEIENSGSIIGGLNANLVATNFTFTNSGLIEGLEDDAYFARGLNIKVGELDLALPEGETIFNGETASFTNTATGEIHGSFYAGAATQRMVFENHGLISASDRLEGIALYVETGLLQRDDEDDALEPAAESIIFRNTGTIEGGTFAEIGDRVATFENSGDIVRSAMPMNAFNPPIFGGTSAFAIQSEADESHVINFTNSGSIIGEDRGGSGLLLEVEAGDDDKTHLPPANATINIVNSGEIKATGGATVVPGQFIGLGPGNSYINQIAALGVDVESTGAGVVNIENLAGGLIEAGGSVNVLTQVPNPQMAPVPWNNIPLAETEYNQTVAIGVAAKTVNIINSGTIRGGAGTDYAPNTPVIDNALGQPNGYLAGAIHTSGDQLEDDSGYYPSIDHVTNTETGVIIGSIDLNAGDDRIDNAGVITGDIYMREGDDIIVNAGTITGDVRMGDGNDSFTHILASAVLNGTVDGGDGINTLAFDITGTVFTGTIDPLLRAKFTRFDIEKIIGTGQVVVEGAIEVAPDAPLNLTEGSSIVVAPGETAINGGNDSVVVANSGVVVGNVDLGSGDNQLVNAAGGSITGDIVTGDGSNTISNAGGSIEGSIVAGAGGDTLANSGIITGNVDLGAGSDTVVIGTGGSFGGIVSGGSGVDVIAFDTGSTYEEQTTIDGSNFVGFEEVNNAAGVNSITGNLEVEQVNVTGGRLIGQEGSTISGTVTVGSGAVFGTAGSVNGTVTVGAGGTLSPGASPAIMTVNGDLIIADNTTTVFEFVPVGQSDQIIVNGGSVTIGDNTTLSLTGSLTPGESRDLIIINGGGTINGDFDIITRDPGIVGVIRNSGTRLQLLGTFVAPADISVQANSAVDYVNDLLIAGTASSALINAVPTLLSGTTANAAAFSQVTPEPYATASQLGVDQGLAIVSAARSGIAATTREEAGLFSFAQGLGSWRTLKGDAATGTASAKGHSYGLLGGLGFGNASASVAAFVGYLDSRQTIAARSARTDADGMVAGVSAHVSGRGLEATLTLARDWSDASTSRAVPGATVRSNSYRLRSTVLDATLGYSIDMGSWAIRPEAGLTHISAKRGAASETGSTAFALDIDRAKTKATFIDGGLSIEGGRGEGAAFKPWASIGIRYQLEGEQSVASAGFIGNAARFTVLGAERKATMATTAIGASYDIAPTLRLYGGYEGAFGGGHSHNVNVGVRFAF